MNAHRVSRPAVLRDVPLDRHAVIEASAGTGKTYALEHLVVELLLATDVTLDGILVVTFTEKATNELRARVRAKLQELLSGARGLSDEQPVRPSESWTIDESARAKLTRALHAFDGGTIATIHAFCQRVLRENAFASGRLFEEQQVDGRDAFARAFRDALRRVVARDRARSCWLEAALRTGWSIERIEELLWRCAQAGGALRPTFAPATLEAAIDAFPIEEARRSSIADEIRSWGTHATTARTIARRLYGVAELVERAREARDTPLYVLQAKGIDLATLLEKLRQVSPEAGSAARVCAAAQDLARATPPFSAALAHALLDPVRDEAARSKREAGRYDFDDMLMLLDEALRGPGGQALVQAVRRRWRYALVDEFQDTDETQWSIFRRAFFDVDNGTASLVYLVGDPKQSIYRFRGADIDTYLRARNEVVAAGGALVRLEYNYRATPALVDATNVIFDARAAEPLFTGEIAYTPVQCGRPERALLDGDGHPVSPLQVLRVSGGSSLQTLAARIAQEICLIADPARPWRLDGRVLEHRDIFVLTRNAREGRAIGAALRADGVPHAFYKEDGLFQTDEAKEVHVLLCAIDDPKDRSRRLAAWLTPFFGLPLVEVERARDLSASHPLVARLHAWKALAEARDFDRLFENIVQDSGIVRREIFFADGERELTNYLHVLEVLLERARATRSTLRDLTNELGRLIARKRWPLDIEGNVQRLEGERSAVQIMTIHKSKGLEAAVVFVAGGLSAPPTDEVRVYHDGEGRLAWVGTPSPEVEPLVKRAEREEEQRLMYVALTRAMGRLYLPCFVDDALTAKGSRAPGGPKSIRGPYNAVNRRVADLARTPRALLGVEDVGATATASMREEASDESWSPPLALLREDRSSAAERYARLREGRAGAIVTSYSRIKGERSGARVAWFEDAGERRARNGAESIDETAPVQLRAARSSGVFLHELLERVPLASFAGGHADGGESAPGWCKLDEWRSRVDVSTLVDEAIVVHRVDREQRDHAERLVWAAYTTSVTLPRGGEIRGFAEPARVTRETDFAYPIPEESGPLFGDVAAGAHPIRRGYVRGSLDLAFEHQGLTYFVDWKSDSLVSYEPGALGLRVAAHYADQVKLYALAVVRLLRVRTRADHEARFGGLLYCFLRGLGVQGHGVWSSCPSWDDVLRWDDELRARRRWGDPER